MSLEYFNIPSSASAEDKLVENYTALLVRWLRGANAGEFGNLYISSRGKGSSLFMKGLMLYHSPKKKNDGDVRVAIIQDNKLRILTSYDTLGLRQLAEKLGIQLETNPMSDFRADGTIKNGIIKIREE